MKAHWVDRLTAPVAPRWTLRRQRARIASSMLERHFDAASSGRRTQGWRRSSGDANAVIGGALSPMRDRARELVRNNPYAESALSTIADHGVGWGIVPKSSAEAMTIWREWGETTACDADGRQNFYGLQWLTLRGTAEGGEMLMRARIRRIDKAGQSEDGLPLPIQMQLLEPDFLDTSKDQMTAPSGNKIIQGIEYDAIGRRAAYWMFREHPGSIYGTFPTSQRVPAEFVTHVFRQTRAGQGRGPSWFAPVMLRARDFDEFEDATLMKAKIAACLAVLVTDPDGTADALGTKDTTKTPETDSLEPGMIMNVAPGRTISTVQPPAANDYDAYSKTQLRAIATGLGVNYEDLTGDYSNMPFSAARMSRLRHWSRVEGWRWRMVVPQLCEPAWRWAMGVAVILGRLPDVPPVTWTAPPAPMIDPVNEGLAYQRLVRSGLQSLSDALRERGYDPEEVLAEIAKDNARLDTLGLVLDSDGRKMTQAGQLQGSAAATAKDVATGSAEDLERFAAWLRTLNDEQAERILRQMFGDRIRP